MRKLLIRGNILTGLAVISLGCLQYIPPAFSLTFTLSAFISRMLQGVGQAAILNASLTSVADMFPESSSLMLVRYNLLWLKFDNSF